jgi:hypothetical protein
MICTVTVNAQTYPAKPIRLIIPFPPGGSNDIVGRIVAVSLGERLGTQVIADNRAGGNSIIGTELVANAPPDGYTLLVISTSFTTNPIIHKLPYDSLKAFAWVAMLGTGPNVMAVTLTLPAKSIKELIAKTGAAGLCIDRCWQQCAFRHRTLQAHDRHQYAACAIQRRRPGADRHNIGTSATVPFIADPGDRTHTGR